MVNFKKKYFKFKSTLRPSKICFASLKKMKIMSTGKTLSTSILIGAILGTILGYLLNNISAWLSIGALAGVTYANIKKQQSKKDL